MCLGYSFANQRRFGRELVFVIQNTGRGRASNRGEGGTPPWGGGWTKAGPSRKHVVLGASPVPPCYLWWASDVLWVSMFVGSDSTQWDLLWGRIAVLSCDLLILAAWNACLNMNLGQDLALEPKVVECSFHIPFSWTWSSLNGHGWQRMVTKFFVLF